MMSLELFDKILAKIISENSYATNITLYNWGEPFLHPKLPEFIKRVKDYGLKCYLSGNLNHCDNLLEIIRANPDEIRITTSGFYQETYGKMHKGGNIEKVRKNMAMLRDAIYEAQIPTYVVVAYLLYLHNVESDYQEMKRLCEELQFDFHGVWAFLNDHDRYLGYFTGDLNAIDDSTINLLAIKPHEAAAVAAKYRRGPCILLNEQMVINSNGSVALCCAVYDNEVAERFLSVSHDQIARMRKGHDICVMCRNYFAPEVGQYAGIEETEPYSPGKIFGNGEKGQHFIP